MSEELMELHAIVRGRVQGVFFRASVFEHAQEVGVRGVVKNLDDGTVEIIAQGTKQQLEQLLKLLKDRPGRGRVERIDTTFTKVRQEFNSFTIAG